MNVIPAPLGLYAVLVDGVGGEVWHPIVALEYDETTDDDMMRWHGVMVIGTEMYRANLDEQFVRYATKPIGVQDLIEVLSPASSVQIWRQRPVVS